MPYDLEKYREKREKVLGVKKRGVSLGTMVAVVSAAIVVGLAVIALPKTIAYFKSRNLDDAIYRLQGEGAWPDAVIAGIRAQEGVRGVEVDKHGSRLVVTFDKYSTSTHHISAFLGQNGVEAVMLNRVSHEQRRVTIEEEAEFEAL